MQACIDNRKPPIALLSVKAGLRAAEIAKLTWETVKGTRSVHTSALAVTRKRHAYVLADKERTEFENDAPEQFRMAIARFPRP